MNMSSVNRHLSKLSPCWKWDFFADKCPNFSRRMRGCYISSRYPPIRDPALCADQLVRGSTGDTVICCCSQNPVNPGHVSRFVLLSRVTSRDAVTPWCCEAGIFLHLHPFNASTHAPRPLQCFPAQQVRTYPWQIYVQHFYTWTRFTTYEPRQNFMDIAEVTSN